jgi:hypothetical protein
MFLLSLLMIGPSIHKLGAEDYWERERAEHRLESLGVLAWLELLDRQRDESPEVRMRVERLLAPYRKWSVNIRAAMVLGGGEYHLPTLFCDYELRMRIKRLALANGCQEADVCCLDPGKDNWDWWSSVPPIVLFEICLEQCRRKIGGNSNHER